MIIAFSLSNKSQKMIRYIHKARTFLTSIQPQLLWVLSAWFAYRLIVNGIRKFDPDGLWSPAFEEWGYPIWFRILIGILELAGGILVVIPMWRHWGSLLLFFIMIGALITRIINGTGVDDALSILSLAVAFLYFATYHRKMLDPI